MTTQDRHTPEDIAFSIQRIIDHAERRWMEQTQDAATLKLLASDNTQEVLNLVKSLLPEAIQAQVVHVLELHALAYDNLGYTRYYVEFLGDQRFGVSEHQDHRKGKSGARRIRDDFSDLESARTEADRLNAVQRQLDLQYGYWAQQAV
jgi:hypothetical protein